LPSPAVSDFGALGEVGEELGGEDVLRERGWTGYAPVSYTPPGKNGGQHDDLARLT
jgi:hypothetical protein